MRWLSPSAIAATTIRFAAYWPMALHLAVNRRMIALTFWLEDRRPLDHARVWWLAGLMLALLLAWLVRDVRR